MPSNNKRKKKPAANPARGFATVSVPSKPKSVDSATPTSTADSRSVTESDRPTPAEPSQPPSEKREPSSLQNYSPEELEKHLENAELQLLVEKLAVKCKNDAARQVTKLETERRVLRQQAVSLNLLEWLPKEAQELILSLAEAEEREISPPSGRESSSLKKTSSEEELYMRLWTLRETLMKLGFPEVKVEETLKHVLLYLPGTSTSSNRDVVPYLDESLDWLALHCLPAELPSYTQSSAQTRNESERLVSFISGKV